MSMQPHWHFIVIPVVWLAAVVLVSIAYRRRAGKPVFPKVPRDALFAERWTSGRSLDHLLARFGGARNCLLVAVTSDELIVTPCFPFNLMFLPEVYGLELSVPAMAVRDVAAQRRFWGRTVTITTASKRERRIELRLRGTDAFLAAIALATDRAG